MVFIIVDSGSIEDYIVKSPFKRIYKVKAAKKVKETFTDENLEPRNDNNEALFVSLIKPYNKLEIPGVENFSKILQEKNIKYI